MLDIIVGISLIIFGLIVVIDYILYNKAIKKQKQKYSHTILGGWKAYSSSRKEKNK